MTTTSTITTTARLCFRDAEQRMCERIKQVEALSKNSQLQGADAPNGVIVSKTKQPVPPLMLSLPVPCNVTNEPGGSFIQPTSLLGRPAPKFQENDNDRT